MVVNDLMKAIKGVYGDYDNKILEGTVRRYLTEDIQPSQYKDLYRIILYYHKAIFKAPCIATIEEAIEKARLKKSKFDPHKQVETKNKWDYREQAKKDKEFDKVPVDLSKMLKDTIRKVDK